MLFVQTKLPLKVTISAAIIELQFFSHTFVH